MELPVFLYLLGIDAHHRRPLAAVIALVVFALLMLAGTAAAQEIENVVPLNTAPHQLALEQPAKKDTSAFRTAAIATIAGNAFDSVTTIAGMQSGGVRETNPVLGQHPGRIVLVKSLLVIPVLLAEKRLVDAGHPKIARFMGYAVGGFTSMLAIHNIRTTR